ncbi:MAG: TatD family hydrolase [Bacteroidales bacterium]|jgi:TatD DNase family protein|nr:TatD family hydrolase [Bacteroidales bacterium]
MKFIDTHSHLYIQDFDKDRDTVIQESLQAGVSHILLPNINLDTLPHMLHVCKAYPDVCFPMTGLHPCDVKANYKDVLEQIFVQFDTYKYIGIGEVGIDLYWDKSFLEEQKDALRIQIRFALKHDLPIIIHKRQSYYETMEVLDEFSSEKLKGIFHCYSGSVDHAFAVIEKGFLLGIGGTVTYKSSNLDTVLPAVPLEKIVLETDSPYLTPVPYRGTRNKSAYIPIIAQKIADIKQITLEEVAAQTTKNAIELFSL